MGRFNLKVAVAFILFLAMAFIAAAQGPAGVGGNVKPVKTKTVKVHKAKKTAPLYFVPKSQPWYLGGGPGPVGAGVK